MANDRRDQQDSRKDANKRESARAAAPQHAGDNRRAGDTDGNAAGGDAKSKGAANPADERPEGEEL